VLGHGTRVPFPGEIRDADSVAPLRQRPGQPLCVVREIS
jgi:hypothetical protein